MANPTGTTRARDPLTRDRVLAAAVTLADTSGIGALSMRRLAQSLGVEAMSLYHHVANKHDLLDGMVDRVFAEIALPDPTAPWRTSMQARAASAREVLLRHPWAVGLLESRTNPGPATLRHHDAVIGALRANGFSIVLSAHAFSAIDSYLYGFVLQELNLPFESSDELEVLAESILQAMPAEEYPHLTEMIVEHNLRPGYRYAEEFQFGFDLVLDGLERALAQE